MIISQQSKKPLQGYGMAAISKTWHQLLWSHKISLFIADLYLKRHFTNMPLLNFGLNTIYTIRVPNNIRKFFAFLINLWQSIWQWEQHHSNLSIVLPIETATGLLYIVIKITKLLVTALELFLNHSCYSFSQKNKIGRCF